MNASLVPDAKIQELDLEFMFQNQGDKLVIHARSASLVYQAELSKAENIDLDDVKDALTSKMFKQVNKTDDALTLKIGGFYILDFKNKEKMILNELKQNITDLTNQLNQQSLERTQLENKVADLTNLLNQQVLKNTQLENIVDTLEAALNEQKRKVLSLEAQLNDVKNQTMNRSKEMENIQSSVLQSKQTVKVLKTKIYSDRRLSFLTELNKMSKVITSVDEAMTVNSFFSNKKISFIQFLYRASEHRFSVSTFHEKCDNIPNTLTLCTSEFGKKIGGFTPLTWRSSSNFQYKTDDSEESFIFSVTHADKFILTEKEHAIRNRKDYGPTFGSSGQDIHISDNADFYNYSLANVNTSYHNSNYKQGDVASWQRFSGNPKPDRQNRFKVKEWEVWRVQFEQPCSNNS